MSYINQTGLLQRQYWTLRRVRLFLGKPDRYEPNPQSPLFRWMKTYDLDRVVKAESSAEFRADIIRYLSKKENEEADAGN